MAQLSYLLQELVSPQSNSIFESLPWGPILDFSHDVQESLMMQFPWPALYDNQSQNIDLLALNKFPKLVVLDVLIVHNTR